MEVVVVVLCRSISAYRVYGMNQRYSLMIFQMDKFDYRKHRNSMQMVYRDKIQYTNIFLVYNVISGMCTLYVINPFQSVYIDSGSEWMYCKVQDHSNYLRKYTTIRCFIPSNDRAMIKRHGLRSGVGDRKSSGKEQGDGPPVGRQGIHQQPCCAEGWHCACNGSQTHGEM